MNKVRILLGCTGLLLLAIQPVQASLDLPGCFAYCNSETCEMEPGYETENSTTEQQFKRQNEIVKLKRCPEQSLKQGQIKLYFAVSSGIEEYLLDYSDKNKDKKLISLVSNLKNAECLFSTNCDPSEYSGTSASIGGKGIDDNSQFNSNGSACSLGLPCGNVLPSQTAVRVSLDSPASAVTGITLAQFRSRKASIDLPVKKQSVEIPAAYFQPSETYVYKVMSGEKEIASGYYQVAATKDVDAYLEELGLEKIDSGAETMVLLFEEGFLWDADRLARHLP